MGREQIFKVLQTLVERDEVEAEAEIQKERDNKVELKPIKSSKRNAKSRGETMDENGVINSVEGN